MTSAASKWYEEEPSLENEDDSILEYDLTATPNDFNVMTIVNFIEKGAVLIPGFQRNYIWDIKRASKLIESILIGLPIPQIFLYEEARNKFLVIDGQQRLMSIYYFVQQRFPRKEKRIALRRIMEERGTIPPEVFADDGYFEKFNLKLPSRLPEQRNPFDGLNYKTLGSYTEQFDLRPIRNIIVKQISPANDDSSVHEIFNRLNSGGITLTPQEIRASLYHSKFYEMLFRVNTLAPWRKFVGIPEPDISLKDLEFLLRAFAMAYDGENYKEPMSKFLNKFSKEEKRLDDTRVSELETVFKAFLAAGADLDEKAFRTQQNRFSVTIFESVFAAATGPMIAGGTPALPPITNAYLEALKSNPDFSAAIQEGSTKKANVQLRLRLAREVLAATPSSV